MWPYSDTNLRTVESSTMSTKSYYILMSFLRHNLNKMKLIAFLPHKLRLSTSVKKMGMVNIIPPWKYVNFNLCGEGY